VRSSRLRQADRRARFWSVQVPKWLSSAVFGAEPLSERVQPETLRAVTAGRRLRSAWLLSAGISGCSTKTNSSPRCFMIRWASTLWGALVFRATGPASASSSASNPGSVQLDSQLALRSQHTGGEPGLRQQQRPREPEHAARKFPDRSQDVPGCEEEARDGTHGGEDSTDSAGKETAQERPDRVSGEGTACEPAEDVPG